MRSVSVIGWIVFALLIIAIGWQFLFACDFRLLGFERNACPVSQIGAERSDTLQQEALMREIHAAELVIAEKLVCLPEKITERAEQVIRDAYDRGAKQGKLEAFLDWSTPDDLDLSVFCPGGHVGGVNSKPGPGVCGDGKLDLDANRNLVTNVVPNPVEHVAWQTDIPPGEYSFRAAVFKTSNPAIGSKIPFRLRIRFDGQERVCEGEIPFYPRSEGRMASSGKLLHSQDFSLRWRFGGPLPQCNWQVGETTYCDPGECDKN
jgi:hypothetical protein